ncbi:MAG: helix-turn-helix domain-containing protein [Candidatus Cloacimonetes bacterium]|nr:helix-turn-helix domain-containing protein [Candidatus Cloacimonadota bacterium]
MIDNILNIDNDSSLSFVNASQLQRIKKLFENFPVDGSDTSNSSKYSLVETIKRDFLNNIFYISQAYTWLSECSSELLHEIKPRLFGSFDEPLEEPLDGVVAVVWFALNDTFREEIINDYNYRSFWEKFVTYIRYESTEFPFRVFLLSYKKGICNEMLEQIKTDFTRDYDSEKIKIFTLEIEDSDWEDENLSYFYQEFTIENIRVSYNEQLFDDISSKFSKLNENTDLKEIRQMVEKLLGSVKTSKRDNEDYFTVEEAAEYCGVTVSTIYNWTHRRILSTVKIGGKKILIPVDELKRKLAGGNLSQEKAHRIARKKLMS